MLAVVWGTEHFHLYLYGSQFDVLTDHQPLIGIFKSQRPTSARIERWRIRLAQYAINLKYRPGWNESNPADFISRHPVLSHVDHVDIVNEKVNYVCTNAVPKAMTVEEVRFATSTDEELQTLITAIQTNKWSDPIVGIYKKISHEISVHNGLILRGNRIIIPKSLREKVINLAHSGHQGVVKTKQLVREKVWFPGIDKDVEHVIRDCLPCQAVTNRNQMEPLRSSDLPKAPWEEVSVDFLGPIPTGEYLLVVMDDYSRFPEVEVVTSTSSSCVIPKLDCIFARQGVPLIVKSDNGPPFNGEEFKKFASYLGFKHRRITPLWPRANGEVEHFMGPLSKVLRTAKIEHKNWRQELYGFLRQYRATPHTTTGVSPAEALNGRKLHTTIPEVKQPTIDLKKQHAKIKQNDFERKQKAKAYWDKCNHAQDSEIKINDTVLVKQNKTNKLSSVFNPEPMIVTNRNGTMITAKRGSYKITRNVSYFKRLSGNTNKSTSFDDFFIATPDKTRDIENANGPNQAQPQLKSCLRKSIRSCAKPVRFKDYV